jgi:hypothetical protein
MRAAIATLLSSLLLTVCWAAPAGWTPAEWSGEKTLELTTDVPSEGSYTFPVWLVVIDGQVYVRLGTRAADRVRGSKSAPLVGVKVAGHQFDHVRCEPAPDAVSRVDEAMAKKYWSDVVVHHMSHPLTCRLVPQ